MNLVIHGIDYSRVPASQKRKFLNDLTGWLRPKVNVNNAVPGSAKINSVVNDIRFVFTATSSSTLNVLIQVPVTNSAVFTAPLDIAHAATSLERNANTIKTQVQADLITHQELDNYATWTRSTIAVKLPGEA